MLKYNNYAVTLRELPDEIALCINLTNCPHRCVGCHSPELQQNIGEELNAYVLDEIIKKNNGITCVCFMGGDNDLNELTWLGGIVKFDYHLKVGWYSGNSKVNLKQFWMFDYIKYGPYIEKKGPLNKKTTNQKLLVRINKKWKDITYKFQN